MKILNYIRWTFIVAIGLYLIYCMVFHLTHDRIPKETYCGKVLKKSYEDVVIKHGSRTDLYLLVDFDNRPTEAINVNETTYLSSNVGERICFKLPMDISIYYFITWILGFLINGAICIGIIVFFVLFLVSGNKIFTKKYYK